MSATKPGSVHDSRKFAESQIGIRFSSGLMPEFLLGDAGYPCKKFLLPPYDYPSTRAEVNNVLIMTLYDRTNLFISTYFCKTDTF